MIKFNNDWDNVLKDEFQKEYYQKLREFLKKEYMNKRIYPNMYDIFSAFKMTPYNDVKVVILGQDPYHEEGQAHGLAFSVKKGIAIPPSLRNIYKELESDLGIKMPNHGCLEEWANRGVLLLNTVLTVREGIANSHKGMGWEIFTDKVIELLNQRDKPVVFILWGNNAKSKRIYIDNPRHHIIEGVHPSPLSAHRGFFGGHFFSRANSLLDEPINWSISE
ncbi:MAG: uracil-DNA glycosylase [Anaerovoracaceae bacterium]